MEAKQISLFTDKEFAEVLSEASLVEFTTEEQAVIDRFLAVYENDVNAVDDNGSTLLHNAAADWWGIEVLKYLILQGLDVNAKTNVGFTPLHVVAEAEDIEATKFLISVGADISARDEDGCTPLHYAVIRDDVAIHLVSKGADIDAKDNDGETPLDWARAVAKTCVPNGYDPGAVKYLESIGAKSGKDLITEPKE